MANYVGNGYAWWVGQDGNIWANINGNVQKMNQTGSSVQGSDGLGYRISARPTNGGINDGVLLYKNNQIADPNVPASNPTDNNTTTTRASGGGSSYNAEEEAMKSRMRGIYDRQIGDINHNIDSLQGQLDNALAGVKNEYNTYKNEQQSAYDANKNDYDKNTLQNRQNLRTNRNEITDRASKGLRGMLRILGAMGAGGGSEARYEIPQMVTDQANSEFNNAGQTYAQNQQNLDTDWGNYKNQFENDRKKLEDWYNGQVKSKKQESEERRQSLLADLVTAYGNRAQYGGDYGNSINDAYNRIAESRNRVADLGRFTPTKYTGMTAVYNAPDLASYDTGKTNLTTEVVDSNTSATSPLLVALQGLNRKKNTSPYANRLEA